MTPTGRETDVSFLSKQAIERG